MTHAASSETFAQPPSTLKIGDREVRRMGYGAMRLPGKDVWIGLFHPHVPGTAF